MDLFSYPTLGECALDVITNKNCLVRTVQNASRELYTVYAESLMANGFVEKEYKEKGGRLFAAYKNGKIGDLYVVFISLPISSHHDV